MNVTPVRRLVAALLVVAMAAWSLAPLQPHDRGARTDCHAGASHGAALSAAAPMPGACDHSSGAMCATMVSCGTVAPALAALPGGPAWMTPLTATRAVFTSGLHGRLALGPPPPPPNS